MTMFDIACGLGAIYVYGKLNIFWRMIQVERARKAKDRAIARWRASMTTPNAEAFAAIEKARATSREFKQ